MPILTQIVLKNCFFNLLLYIFVHEYNKNHEFQWISSYHIKNHYALKEEYLNTINIKILCLKHYYNSGISQILILMIILYKIYKKINLKIKTSLLMWCYFTFECRFNKIHCTVFSMIIWSLELEQTMNNELHKPCGTTAE